jgi:excisionase family DNA binding protein
VREREVAEVADVPEVVGDGAVPLREAVRFSGLTRTALYAAMSRGELPFVKIGKRRLIPRNALRQLLAGGLVGGAVVPAT